MFKGWLGGVLTETGNPSPPGLPKGILTEKLKEF